MAHGIVQRTLTCLLVICILMVGGLASAQSIAHESHHAHHQKATHATVLCTWMCAAGQASETATVFLFQDATTHESVEPISPNFVATVFSTSLTTRGPPVR